MVAVLTTISISRSYVCIQVEIKPVETGTASYRQVEREIQSL